MKNKFKNPLKPFTKLNLISPIRLTQLSMQTFRVISNHYLSVPLGSHP